MRFFGHKPEINVTMTYDVMMKCRCLQCPVQIDSACAKPKIAARNELLQNPGKTMSNMFSPGMMKNLDMVKNLRVGWGGIQGKSKEELQHMSDQMMQNTPKEQLGSMMPKPEDLPGPYCANGVAVCKDLDYGKLCQCSGCQVFADFKLNTGRPTLYYCRDGKAK